MSSEVYIESHINSNSLVFPSVYGNKVKLLEVHSVESETSDIIGNSNFI